MQKNRQSILANNARIFESVYRKTLGARAGFLIPADVEDQIRLGSDERYLTQIEGTRNLQSEVPEVQKLIGWIHQYGKGYDQEGISYGTDEA